MNLRDAVEKLKSMGTAQNRKIYARHGVSGKMYGVSFANLTKLKKAIKADHELALKLWGTGNHDARVLATMVAEPHAADPKLLEEWAKELDNYVVTDAFSGLAAKSPHAQKKMEKWTKSKKEFVGQAGYNILASLAMKEGEFPDKYFGEHLKTIEGSIHKSRNRARYAMNNALISIGTRTGSLEKKAIATAKRIGEVEVDHGETGCKTPDAVTYIPKARAHRAKKAASKRG